MYNLCNQHLQNFMTLLLSSLASDGCLEVRDGLEVVLIHPVLEVTPQIEAWGVQV